MNRTQAKARAADLGISKAEARQFGNLSKTQTWLDAIAAHDAEPQSMPTLADEPIDAMETPDCCPVLPLPSVAIKTPEALSPQVETVEPLCPDPWSRDPEPVTAPETVAARQVIKPEPPEKPATPLVYPLLLVLVLAWSLCQLLLGLGGLLAVGLKSLAQRADHAATTQLVQLRTATVPPSTIQGLAVSTLQPES